MKVDISDCLQKCFCVITSGKMSLLLCSLEELLSKFVLLQSLQKIQGYSSAASRLLFFFSSDQAVHPVPLSFFKVYALFSVIVIIPAECVFQKATKRLGHISQQILQRFAHPQSEIFLNFKTKIKIVCESLNTSYISEIPLHTLLFAFCLLILPQVVLEHELPGSYCISQGNMEDMNTGY